MSDLVSDIQEISPKKAKLTNDLTQDDSKQESAPKRAKLTNDVSIHDNIKNLSNFEYENILSINTNRKTVSLKGKFSGSEGVGLIILEKSSFTDTDFKNGTSFFSSECSLRKDFSNDVYGNYTYFPNAEFSGIKTTIIHPASQKQIDRFSTHKIYLVNETPEIYKNVTLPYIEKEQLDLQWIYNVLEGKSETERVLYEDSDPEIGFTLLPDLKWDAKTPETLYLLAIVQDRGIKSIRELTGKHIPLLKNILEKGTEAIKTKYGLEGSQLRIYLHYRPSFYHLHVHFTYIQHDAPGIYAERAHMLSNVISNLELLPDYYKKATIPFIVHDSDNLFKHLKEKDILKFE